VRAATGLVLAAALLAAAAPAGAQQARQPRNCIVALDTAGRLNQLTMADGSQVVYVGGIFKAHCRDQPTTMASDSVEWYGTPRSELFLIGNAHFRDSTEALDADRVTYWTRQERLYSEGHVYTRNVKSGSELRGPNMDYFRAVPPIRDTVELLANGRPTIRLHRENEADTANPFVIVADRVKLRHSDRFWGSGRVTIDRRDLRARADSALLSTRDSFAWLIGAPVVDGRDTTRPADDTGFTYRLTGQRIRFDLTGDQEVRRVLSYRDADAQGPDWRLTADTIDMRVDSGLIQRAQAWGGERRPVAVSGLSTIIADSLDIQMPDQVMRIVLAYRGARAVSKADSSVTEADWLTGDSLRADFVRIDSGGVKRSDIDHVVAYGSARAYYHSDAREPQGERPINYSRGNRIVIALHERKVRVVDIVGRVDGVYLEPLAVVPDTLRRDSLPADSARADSTRADSTRAAAAGGTEPRPPASAPAAPTAPATGSPPRDSVPDRPRSKPRLPMDPAPARPR